MGKGDKKSKRGKITNGSYGVRRPRKSSTTVAVLEKPKKVKAEKAEPKPKAAKAKAEKSEEVVSEEKPKVTRKKKNEE